MTITVILLSRWEPEYPDHFGPLVEVIAEKIVAIETVWDKKRMEERAKIHFMGGGTMSVVQSRRMVWDAMMQRANPLPVRAQNG